MNKPVFFIVALAVAASILAPANVFSAIADPSHFAYTVSVGEATITGYTGPGGDITIPDTLGGHPVVCIDFYAFAENSSITRVTLPADLVTIFEGAFFSCTRLASIDFPADLLLIGEGAFSQCTNLVGVALPTNLTFIGSAAFANCGRFASLSLPASLDYIGSSAFTGCNNLTSIAIPSGLTTIESYVFENCTRLAKVEIPASISRIDYNEFAGCSNLTRMYFAGSPPSLIWYGFAASRATIYYLPSHADRWPSTYDGRPTLCWNPVVGNMTAPSSTTPFSFPITGTPSIPVAVEACANLSAGTWDRLLATNLPPAGVLEFTDTPDSSSHSSRFYRVVAP